MRVEDGAVAVAGDPSRISVTRDRDDADVSVERLADARDVWRARVAGEADGTEASLGLTVAPR